MKSASYEYRKMSARRGAQFVPIGMPTVCWKTFPAKTTRNSSILMMSSSEYLLLESECSFTKYVSSCPNTKYLYLRLPFLKMKAFHIEDKNIWQNIYHSKAKEIFEKSVAEFKYKLLNNILNNNYIVSKWKKEVQKYCSVCFTQVEKL